MRLLTGAAATEAAFERAAPGSRVIHMATHGFFLDGSCGEPTADSRGVGGLVSESTTPSAPNDRPSGLRLAGLVLAGANRRDDGARSGEDGILTAEEIAAMNLEGVDWAVLSACDSGLGEPRSGEGVLGLRRAFLIAGARTVIMSLWSVDDASTAAWMRELYRARFVEGSDSMRSVALATMRTLADRRARGQSTHPFFWAGFQAGGDWR